MKHPTVRQIEAARSVLLWFSEHSEVGRLRDAIGEVRHALADEIDDREPGDSR